MAHTFDTKLKVPASGLSTANPVTSAYTCGAGTTVLTVALLYAASTARTGGAPTYNGVAFTQADIKRSGTPSPEASVEVWYLLAPPTGSSLTLNVPNVNTRSISVTIASFKAAAGSISAFDVTNGAGTAGTNPTVSVTTTIIGDVLVAAVADGAQLWAPSARTGTQLYDTDLGSWGGGSQYLLKSDAGVQAMAWTFGTSEDYGLVVAAFKETRTINVHEDISLSDTPAANITGGAYTVSVSDTASLTDTPTNELVSFITAEEDITVGESLEFAQVAFEVAVHEDVTVTDIPRYYPEYIIVSEYIEIAVLEQGALFISVSDTVTVTIPDFVGGSIAGVNVNDAITVTESVAASIGGVSTFAISKTESVTVTEDVTVEIAGSLFVSKSESITLTDSYQAVTSDPQVAVEDNVTLTDEPTVETSTVSLVVDVFDNATVSESIAAEVSTSEVNVTSSVTVTEAVAGEVSTVPEFYVSVTESITISDSYDQRVSTSQIYACEDIVIGDFGDIAAIEVGALGVGAFEGIIVTESITPASFLTGIAVSDTITVSEPVFGEFEIPYVGLILLHGWMRGWTLTGDTLPFTLHGKDNAFTLTGKENQ